MADPIEGVKSTLPEDGSAIQVDAAAKGKGVISHPFPPAFLPSTPPTLLSPAATNFNERAALSEEVVEVNVSPYLSLSTSRS